MPEAQQLTPFDIDPAELTWDAPDPHRDHEPLDCWLDTYHEDGD